MRRKLIAALVAAGFALPAVADDATALRAELKRLADRIESLERQNKDMEKALATERLSEKEPEIATRLKATEAQVLAMQKPVGRLEEALDGVSAEGSLVAVWQQAGAGSTASGQRESHANYRGDLNVTLPGGSFGDAEGSFFTHLRFGQGNGVALKPTFTSTANSVAFEKAGTPADDSFAILAQAWYQLSIPFSDDGFKPNAREHVKLTAGKIDPFVFFDQNAIADDESSRFLNNVFVHNPLLDSGGGTGADAYGFAPGLVFQYMNEHDKGAEWGLSFGIFGSGPGANFSSSQAHPFVIAQAERAVRWNYLPGNYRLYAWTNGRGTNWDGTTQSHSGIGFSIDQKVSDNLTLFTRYGHQWGGRVAFDRALTVGGELEGAGWGRAADGLGFAFGTAHASTFLRNEATVDADGDGLPDIGYYPSGSEKQAELYYRWKFNSHVEITPDFQLITRPAGNGASERIHVAGLRAKFGF